MDVQQDEKSLLKKIKQSDHKAFGDLYDRYWKELYVYALRKIGNEADVADIVQNIFTELWDKRSKIPVVQVKEKYYLTGILVHKIARYYRDKGGTDEHRQNFFDFVARNNAEKRQPSDGMEREELHTRVVALVNREIEGLPEKMRNIFVLSCTRKYTIVEIANLFQVAPQTVKNQVSTALSRIRSATRKYKLVEGELLHLLAILLCTAHLYI